MLLHMLQALQRKQTNCTLIVSDPDTDADGYLYIQDGSVVSATLNDSSGVEAATEMMTWDEPEIVVYALPHSVVANVPPEDSQRWLDAPPQVEAAGSPSAAPAAQATLAAEALADDVAEPALFEADVVYSPQPSAESPVQHALLSMLAIDGAVRAAVVEWMHGVVLGTMEQGVDAEVAAAGNANVTRLMHMLMDDLGATGGVEDVVVTLAGHYHVVHALESHPQMCMYLVLNREYANLALTRYRLEQIEQLLEI